MINSSSGLKADAARFRKEECGRFWKEAQHSPKSMAPGNVREKCLPWCVRSRRMEKTGTDAGRFVDLFWNDYLHVSKESMKFYSSGYTAFSMSQDFRVWLPLTSLKYFFILISPQMSQPQGKEECEVFATEVSIFLTEYMQDLRRYRTIVPRGGGFLWYGS